MRAIDADALKYTQAYEPCGNGQYKAVNIVYETDIEAAPTIDAVPVVRCRDCKHWGMHKRLNVPWCFEMHIDKSEDGYCDSGDRSE